MSKSIFLSKTLWFNVLAVIVLVAGHFGYAEFKPNDDLLILVGVLVPIVNVVLRKITKQPVHL